MAGYDFNMGNWGQLTPSAGSGLTSTIKSFPLRRTSASDVFVPGGAAGVNSAAASAANPLIPASGSTPGAGGGSSFGWMDGLNLAKDIGGIGLGIWNGMQQQKVNDFMMKQAQASMDLQKTDFSNQARAANEVMAARQSRLYDAMGMGVRGSAANEKAVAAYMQKWGADTKV